MTLRASVKAGAIGVGATVVLSLIGSPILEGCSTWIPESLFPSDPFAYKYVGPCVGCIWGIPELLLYVGIGALAAYWLPPVRTAGQGAGAGAIAGVVAGIVGGIVNMVIAALRFLISGGPAAAMRQMGQPPPEVIGGVIGVSAMCRVVGFVLAAILGAIGGVIFAAAKLD